RVRPWIFFERANHAEQQHRHGGSERRVLRIDEHVAVIERAAREQDQRDQSGDGATKVAADSPRCDQSDYANKRAHEPARFKKGVKEECWGEGGPAWRRPPLYL